MNELVKPASLSAAESFKAFSERYGSAPASATAPWNDVLEQIFTHRSVRSYLPDALPPGTLETLIGAAQSAATSSNLQMWSVLAVEDAGKRAKLAELAGNQAHIAKAPLLLVFLADLSRASRIATQKGINPEAVDYIDSFLVASLDAAISAQNAALAAESLGLGTVYIGALRNKISDVASELNLPPYVYPVFGLVVGHPDPAVVTDIKPRLPQSVVLHRETYQAGVQESADIAAYDGYMQDFQKKQGMQPADWSLQISQRIATKGGLNGRERLRTALENFGFLLK